MKVFRITLNSNVFQSLLPADLKVWKTDVLIMDCKPKLPAWKPPAVYVENPIKEQGNFLHLCSGAFVVDSSACEALRTMLEMAGELLPLPHQGALFHLINVLECVNCLDQENTKWFFGKTTNVKTIIKEYHFHADRISESTLFKIPETHKGEVLTVSGMKDPEDEFKSIVEREGLKGIIFEELWSDSR